MQTVDIFQNNIASAFIFLYKWAQLNLSLVLARCRSPQPGSVAGGVLRIGRHLRGHEGLALLLLLLHAGRLVCDGGEGQLVVLHNVHLVFILVLLHIEHLPELLQLMELTEGLQDHQHGDEAQQQVTCVKTPQRLSAIKLHGDTAEQTDALLLP